MDEPTGGSSCNPLSRLVAEPFQMISADQGNIVPGAHGERAGRSNQSGQGGIGPGLAYPYQLQRTAVFLFSRPGRVLPPVRRELLALVLAVRHFRTYLNSKRFLSRTNHVSLTLLLSFKNPESQDARWLEALQ